MTCVKAITIIGQLLGLLASTSLFWCALPPSGTITWTNNDPTRPASVRAHNGAMRIGFGLLIASFLASLAATIIGP